MITTPPSILTKSILPRISLLFRTKTVLTSNAAYNINVIDEAKGTLPTRPLADTEDARELYDLPHLRATRSEGFGTPNEFGFPTRTTQVRFSKNNKSLMVCEKFSTMG